MVFQSFALYPHLNVFKIWPILVEDGVPRGDRAAGQKPEMPSFHRLQQKPATLSEASNSALRSAALIAGRSSCFSMNRSQISTPSSR